MNTKNINDFVTMLEIPEDHEHKELTSIVQASPAVSKSAMKAMSSDNTKSAQVNAGSLISFTDKLTGQNKADVQNSTLLAQLAANKKYDRFRDPMDWYKFYLDVLGNIGWNQPAFSFDNYTSGKDSVKLDDAVIGILEAIATQNEIAIMTKTIDALKNSADDTKARNIWHASSTNKNNGNFQIFPVDISANSKDVVMVLSGLQFKATESHGGFLWWKWESKSIKIERAASKLVLNTSVYEQVRNQIIAKLGDKAKTYIADLII